MSTGEQFSFTHNWLVTTWRTQSPEVVWDELGRMELNELRSLLMAHIGADATSI